MSTEPLLNGKELAEALGRSPCYVTAMIRAGYVFQYPGLRKTTLSHALAALANEDFTAWDHLRKGWRRRPACLAAPASQKV